MALGVADVLVGHWTDDRAETGVTVVLPPAGTLGAMAVRGGAPGTREAAALSNVGSGVECHGVVLCGNSVFGLAAADGVVGWCAERGRGLDIRASIVPVVAAAVVYDIASPDAARPSADAGRLACEAAADAEPATGRVGVGRGCTVGKAAGRDFCVPGGVGTAVRSSGALSVGAIVAVNALGDVIDVDGSVLAGTSAPDDAPRYPVDPVEDIPGFDGRGRGNLGGAAAAGAGAPVRENTTIGCIVTNAALDKATACRAADLAHTGIARAVEPPHTAFDGDALFLLATGQLSAGGEDGAAAAGAGADLVAMLAADAVAAAIRAAVARG